MADPVEITSVRTIITNADYLSNWITTVVMAGAFSALISFKDKLTGAAVMVSFLSATLLASSGWPLLLQYGFANLSFSIAYGVLCGLAGMTMLMTIIGIIARFYRRKDDIADSLLKRGGVEPPDSKP